jgi:hypothetical protein
MKRARRPGSVPPPAAPAPAGSGDEPPFTDDELREAAALRQALERGDDPLASALRAAWAPAPLDSEDLAALVEGAIREGVSGEGDAPPTRLEREAAAALRDELAAGQGFGEATALLGDLKAAYRPGELSPAANEALIEAALAGALTSGHAPASAAAAPRLRVLAGGASVGAPARAARRLRIAPVTMAALSGVAALAAGIALLLGRLDHALPPEALPAATLIHARSTDDLFDPAQKFEVGAQSARVDRIASARAADLRNNRFAAWGVR